jgi:hypothetical protein
MAFSDLPESTRAEYQRIGRERELASREADRAYRWELLRVCAEMIGWTTAGVLIAGLAFRVTEYQTGMILLYSGMVLNIGGIAYAIWSAYLRGERRGDW